MTTIETTETVQAPRASSAFRGATYARLGRLLADILNVSVFFLEKHEHPCLPGGWASGGSEVLRVQNGGFLTEEDAYSDLAFICRQFLDNDDVRYRELIDFPALKEIDAAIRSACLVEDVFMKSKSIQLNSAVRE